MNYNVKTTGLDLSPALSQHLESAVKSISRFTNKTDNGVMIDVEVGKISDHHQSGAIYRAAFNVTLPHQKLLRSEETEYDIYTAVNSARKEVVRQIKTTRKKQDTLIKRGGRRLKDALRGWRRPKA